MFMRPQRTVQFYAETTILQKNGDASLCLERKVHQKLSNLSGLRDFCNNIIKNTDVDKGTYKIVFGNDIIVTDADTNSTVARIGGKCFSFIFSTTNKLLYTQDIPNLFSPYTAKPIGKYTSLPVYIKTFDGCNAQFRSLTHKDTVLDENLHLIWPYQTHNLPRKIVNIIAMNSVNLL